MTVRITDIKLDGLLTGRRKAKDELDRALIGWRAEVDAVPLPEIGPISNTCTAEHCGICKPKEHAPSYAMRWQGGDWVYRPSSFRTVPYGQKP